MEFGWINLINGVAVIFLVIVNVFVFKLGLAIDMKSKFSVVNVLEQIGRYGCMALMILPVVKGFRFGFKSSEEFVVWMISTPVFLVVYSNLWLVMGIFKKKKSKTILYLIAIVPVGLFVINGILLRHVLLIGTSVIFGVCHLWIVKENIKNKGETYV